MIQYKDLLILQLSGLLEKHNEKEIIIPEEMMKNCVGAFFTCEFFKDSKYIIRGYCKRGHKYWEREYKNGLQHGKSSGWHENGNKHWEYEWENGKLHGKSIVWWKNGNKRYEEEYQNGKRHGKSIVWWKNGNKRLEEEYENGKLIRSKT